MALPLRQAIRLESVHFSYGQDQPKVLQGINLQIRRGERIGLIGSTGSGKSTTVDLLMGLLTPTAGRLLVDDVDLHDLAHPETSSGMACIHCPCSAECLFGRWFDC